MSLTIRSFFDRYILSPNEAPTQKERRFALAASIAIFIFTLGIAHTVCTIRRWCIKPVVEKNVQMEKIEQVAKKSEIIEEKKEEAVPEEVVETKVVEEKKAVTVEKKKAVLPKKIPKKIVTVKEKVPEKKPEEKKSSPPESKKLVLPKKPVPLNRMKSEVIKSPSNVDNKHSTKPPLKKMKSENFKKEDSDEDDTPGPAVPSVHDKLNDPARLRLKKIDKPLL